jgi:predicted house-cleaning noncanonical NTP pyrophosphatase (MazG superfamily)
MARKLSPKKSFLKRISAPKSKTEPSPPVQPQNRYRPYLYMSEGAIDNFYSRKDVEEIAKEFQISQDSNSEETADLWRTLHRAASAYGLNKTHLEGFSNTVEAKEKLEKVESYTKWLLRILKDDKALKDKFFDHRFLMGLFN